MPEKCVLEPGRECPNSTDIALLKRRVDLLEEGQDREEGFRKSYYKEREDRIKRDTELDAKITGIDGKVDQLILWQTSQQSKPGKRWDSIVDKIIWFVVEAILIVVAVKVGLR